MDYPELRKVKSFSNLKSHEMLFVWYHSCESSPYYGIENSRERIKKCLDETLIKKGKISKIDIEKYLLGKFPSKIERALEDMSRYRVGPRIRAKMIIEKGFENMESILNIDATDSKNFLNKDDEVDFGKKKAYVDTLAKATELMPKLINQLEGSFSLKEDLGNDEISFEGESLIDSYHEQTD